MGLCSKCADKSCTGYDSRITECEDFRPETNADRIRNMDDYDLAIFLENVSCKHADTESWLDWLKQEG